MGITKRDVSMGNEEASKLQSRFETEMEFSIESESVLLKCFREKDQRKVILPKELPFPFRVRSYFTWKESSGVYTYLVFKKSNWDLPKGLVFKKINSEISGGICSWCNCYGNSEEIGFLSISVNSEISFSYVICSDLRCIEKIEEMAVLAGKNPERWVHQLYHRIGNCFEGISNYRSE